MVGGVWFEFDVVTKLLTVTEFAVQISRLEKELTEARYEKRYEIR